MSKFELPLPTRSDFVRSESLDEIEACRTFLGKTITEAVAVIQENAFARLDDLRHMGTPAFEFYVVAFLGAMDPSVVDLEADPGGWIFEWDVLREILLERLSTPDSPELMRRCASAVSSWCHRTATAREFNGPSKVWAGRVVYRASGRIGPLFAFVARGWRSLF